MINPILRVRYSIQRRGLDVDVRVAWVKVYISDCCRLVSGRRGYGNTFEEWWNDQVDILSRVWEEPNHGESHEGSHCSAIVVSEKSGTGRLKEGRNVEMGSLR